jgi:hypothetical protein
VEELLKWANGPGGLNELLYPSSPGTQELRRAKDTEELTGLPQSKGMGFKLMSPNVRDAIEQFEQRVPSNVHGIVRDSPREYGQVFHDFDMGRLRPGIMAEGTSNSVDVPSDVHRPTARVNVHSHPYTGRDHSNFPSISDQMVARSLPNVEHIVQTPAPGPGQANVYLTYSGAVPPRHHVLVPNPNNLPVPPPSPDGSPKYHPMPGEGSGSGAVRE